MNRPNSVSTWPIVMPFSSPPAVSSDLVRRALALAEQSACGSLRDSGSGRSGVVTVSAMNLSKRSARVVRADGICTWATEVSGTKNVRRAEIGASSARTRIWHGSVSVCSVGAG